MTPAWSAFAARSALPMSRLQIEPDSPYGRRVRQAERLLLGVERDDRDDRAEDLLAGDAHVVVDAVEDRRHEVGAVGQGRIVGRARRRRRASRPRRARSRCSRLTRSRCFVLTSVPTSVASSAGSPTLTRPGRRRRTARRPARGPSARRGSGSGRSSPGRSCRRRCTATPGRTSRGRRRRRRCWGSCRRARARSSSRCPRPAA